MTPTVRIVLRMVSASQDPFVSILSRRQIRILSHLFVETPESQQRKIRFLSCIRESYYLDSLHTAHFVKGRRNALSKNPRFLRRQLEYTNRCNVKRVSQGASQ